MNEKIIVFDGATGTNLQNYGLTLDDFGGKDFEGCNEYLCISKPEVVKKLHYSFLEAGADVIETNSFGSSFISLAEYNIPELDYELSYLAAKLAKECANEYSNKVKPRFVAGSVGPTSKLPSLGHISFDNMQLAFYRQINGLIDGGVDIICIETCQDVLQIKSALSAIQKIFREKKIKLPVIVSVTIEPTGAMLLGTDISAVYTSIEPYDIIDIFGLNCATGPEEMEESLRYICDTSERYVFCMPNAGIPENINGKMYYKLTEDELSSWMSYFISELGVNIIGGCCGTKPSHIRLLSQVAENLSPKTRETKYTPSVSSLFTVVPLKIDIPPILVGERCNANGSKQFRELLLKDDYDSIIDLAKRQMNEGAHILDLSVIYTGRDEVKDMYEIVRRFNRYVGAPLMIDSTNPLAIETALKNYGGRAIINSVNFEDGIEKAEKILSLAKQFGAAVIVLPIDQEGQAYTVEKKISIAKQIRDFAVNIIKLRDEDLIYDMLTFPLGTGAEELRKSALNTLEAIRGIKKILPNAKTILGISNCSYGLNENARIVLNSVFMHYAVEAGLDIAIVNAGKILPIYKIDDKLKNICRELIFDLRRFSEEKI
ncbi:MAG: homocysteine S-methyltransferase family protein [Ignavibacteria bacterium]|nr:homocysteine S-methyltransferase family protein [Ignavibacteria bacterium]